jgi:hypothetical protein
MIMGTKEDLLCTSTFRWKMRQEVCQMLVLQHAIVTQRLLCCVACLLPLLHDDDDVADHLAKTNLQADGKWLNMGCVMVDPVSA